MDLKLEYEHDLHQWIQEHIRLLQTGRFQEIDAEHLIEELQDMAGRDREELISHLVILMTHLLKWQFQQLHERWREFEGKSWQNSIIEQRYRIQRQLKKKPSLKAYFAAAMTEAYLDAVDLAIKETFLPASTFPTQCPYRSDQLLEDNFYPQSR
jgi:hypothetical protein